MNSRRKAARLGNCANLGGSVDIMSIELLIYLAGVSGNIAETLRVLAIIILIGGGFFLIVSIAEGHDYIRRLSTIAVSIGIPLLLLASLIPSKEIIYLMVGAHIAKETAQSRVGEKVQRLLESKLDELLEKKK